MLRSDNFDFAANCKGLNRTDAYCTFAAIKVVGNKNCRCAEDKKIIENLKSKGKLILRREQVTRKMAMKQAP